MFFILTVIFGQSKAMSTKGQLSIDSLDESFISFDFFIRSLSFSSAFKK